MIGHRLFVLWNLSYLHAVIFEIPKQYFIIKPPACWGADVSIEIYELLLVFSIITPCANKGVAVSWHLTVKKSLKIITECRVMLQILYHKRDPLITKTESQINSNERKAIYFYLWVEEIQPTFTCSKLTIKALEQGVKYVQN